MSGPAVPIGYDEARAKIGGAATLDERHLRRLAQLQGDRTWVLRGRRWHLTGHGSGEAHERGELPTAGAQTCVQCLVLASGHNGIVGRRARVSEGLCELCEWRCNHDGRGAAARARFDVASHALRELGVLAGLDAAALRETALAQGHIDATRAGFLTRLVPGASVALRVGGEARSGRVVDASGVDMPFSVAYLVRQRQGRGAGRSSERRMSFDALGERTGPLAMWSIAEPT